jgi:predicted O-methyltransferase YrrM
LDSRVVDQSANYNARHDDWRSLLLLLGCGDNNRDGVVRSQVLENVGVKMVRSPPAGPESQMRLHPETWLELAETGPLKPYSKTFDFSGDFINDSHASIAAAPGGRQGIPVCIDLGFDGYLAHTEALKLYELAYFAKGDVLELGTYNGLSTSIIARGIFDSRRRGCFLTTCDIDLSFVEIAKRNLRDIKEASIVRFNVGDASDFMDSLIAKELKFGFIFVDHWHGYEATYQAAIRIAPLLSDGGLVMFHDYNDDVSKLPDHIHKVYQAVGDTIVKDAAFRFSAIVGGSAIFQKF